MEWISVDKELPKLHEDVLIYNAEGFEVAQLVNAEDDGLDSMGHDGGFIGVFAFPSRTIGNPKFYSEEQGQPDYWMRISPPEDK